MCSLVPACSWWFTLQTFLLLISCDVASHDFILPFEMLERKLLFKLRSLAKPGLSGMRKCLVGLCQKAEVPTKLNLEVLPVYQTDFWLWWGKSSNRISVSAEPQLLPTFVLPQTCQNVLGLTYFCHIEAQLVFSLWNIMGALVTSFLQHTAGPCLSCALHECFLTLSPHHEGLCRALSVPLFAPVATSFSSTFFDFFNWTNSSLAFLPTEHIINELEVLLCE